MCISNSMERSACIRTEVLIELNKLSMRILIRIPSQWK